MSAWREDELGADFLLLLEHGPEAGSYDAWKAEEWVDWDAQRSEPGPRPWLKRRPVPVLEDVGLASGPCGLYVRRRDVREAEEFEWRDER